MKKNKIRKMEISELFNSKLILKKHHCFNPEWERLYYDYLNNKGIELQYHKRNLKDYIEEQKKSLFEIKDQEEAKKEFNKKENLLFMKKCLLYTLFPLGLYWTHVAGRDALIHEQCNVVNSYMMLNDMSSDTNFDGIPEIDTSILEYINEYSKPTDDKYYANTNFLYNLSDNLRVLDNISFMIAMESLGYDIVEIDGILYSKTGKITEINYVENGEKKINCTSKTFDNNEELIEYLNSVSENLPYKREISNITTKLYDVKELEDIPTIRKNKEDGTITIDKPLNRVETTIAMKVLGK